MEVIGLFLGVAIGGIFAWYLIKFFLLFLRVIWDIVRSPIPSAGLRPDDADELDGMNAGDYYNGPGGYDAQDGYSGRH